jgi:Spy/CpxP family protein refolding chaperone
MNRKLLAIATGAILFSAPFVPQLAQAQPMPPDPMQFVSELNLTADQQVQLKQLQSQVMSQVESILSPAQQQQLQTIRANGQQIRQSLAAMNLTAEQKQQLRQVFQSTRTQLNTVLTPAQQEQLRQKIQSRMQAR